MSASAHSTHVYDEPLYYEIAFGFIKPPEQVDLFEEFINRYSKIPVKRILDIGCGPGLQIREMAKRGYEIVGLDSSTSMLKYLRKRAREEGTAINTLEAGMTDFCLKPKADLVLTMMGTISYIKNNKDFLKHLDSVADSLNSGGLYLIENFRLDWSSNDFLGPGGWVMRRDGIQVETTYHIELIDTLEQKLRETMTLDVDDHGEKLALTEIAETKMIFPQELLILLELNGEFEFIGWFERDSTKRLREASMDNITLLRRR
jgi:SAM-dependent methyltransferase